MEEGDYMITDAIINALLFFPTLLLTQLESLNFSFSLPDDIYNTLYNLTVGVAYVLPLPWLLVCFGVRTAVYLWRIPYSIVLRIKSFIPSISGS